MKDKMRVFYTKMKLKLCFASKERSTKVFVIEDSKIDLYKILIDISEENEEI